MDDLKLNLNKFIQLWDEIKTGWLFSSIKALKKAFKLSFHEAAAENASSILITFLQCCEESPSSSLITIIKITFY